MRIILIAFLIFLSANTIAQQSIDFSSYSRVTNQSFRQFLNQFPQKNLPFSTDAVLTGLDLEALKRKPPLAKNYVDTYLRKPDGSLICGPLYKEKPDDNEPIRSVEGNLYPLYKLPTNGDYVLLAYAHVSPVRECSMMIFVLSYDLNGNYIYFANYTFEAGTENINNFIDTDLRSHRTYVINDVDGALVFPSMTQIFSAKEGHLIYQINADGRSTRVSFDVTPGQFQYRHDQCRFKKL